MNVYVLTEGWYSDRHIIGVFSTKDGAENAARVEFSCDESEYAVEEWELDKLPQHPPNMNAWEVLMDRHGNTSRVKRESNEFGVPWEWAPYGTHGQGFVVFRMWAEDERHAVKIANERRIGLLASGEWEDDWHKWRARERAREAATKAAP